ncbi:MAG: hypothetical protein ABUT20_61615, partial [Bacteroidota bacterium]
MNNRPENIASSKSVFKNTVVRFYKKGGGLFFALVLTVGFSLKVGAQTASISGTTTVCQNGTQPLITFT